MENLEFYDHGSRFKYSHSDKNISTVHITMGTATILKGNDGTCLYLVLELFFGPKETIEFQIKGDKYLKLMYIYLDDLIFFATNEEYIIFRPPQILVHKSWTSKVQTLELSQGFKLVIWHEDGTVLVCDMNPKKGDILNPFQCDLDAEPGNVQGASGTYKRQPPRQRRATSYVAEGGPSISWGPADDSFVINTIRGGARILMVFSKTGQLLYKSKPGQLPGMEVPLAVDRENGLIACILSQTGSDQELIIVEKNLEILYYLQLENEAKVQKIQWSNCSEVIAIWQKSQSRSWLDLYMRNDNEFNWKQRLPFSRSEELLDFRFAFSMVNSFIVQLILKSYAFQYSFLKKLSKSECFGADLNASSENKGKQIELYIYGRAILPKFSPTRATIPFQEYVLTVVYDSFHPRFAVIDIAYKVTIFLYAEMDYRVISEFSLDTINVVLPMTYYRFFFDHKGNFCAIRMGYLNDLTTDTIYYYLRHNSALLQKRICNPRIIKGQCLINRSSRVLTENELLRLVPAHNALITDYSVIKFRYEYVIARYCAGNIDVNSKSLNYIFTSIHFTNTHILFTCNKENDNDTLVILNMSENHIHRLVLGPETIFDIARLCPIKKGAVILNDVPQSSMIILLLPNGSTECFHLPSP